MAEHSRVNAGLDRIDYDPGDLPPGVAPGAVIAGKYRLDHVIGMGGMGSVWQATHIGINQPVALKIVSPEFARSTEARRRFDTEAKAAAQLRSRHVVAISDNGELADGTPFMAMELLHGEPLGKRIHKFGPLPVLDALRVVIQVGRALGKAHAVGIVHRDVKPENIFLATHDEEPGYVAKVLDFGIAKVRATNAGEQSATRTGSLLGTPLYMSPEQARALKTVDHRSDIYSLGLVVYTMLTGNLAFSGESYADVIVQICTMPLPTIRGSAPWIPEQVDQWLQYACAKEQENRYQDVQSMVDALCVACGYPPGSPELAQPIGPGQPAFPYAGTVPLMPSRDDVLGPANPHAAQSSGGFPTPGPILTPGPLPPPPTPPPGYVSASQAPPPMGPPMGPPMPGPSMGATHEGMAMAPAPYASSGYTNLEPPKRSMAPWIALVAVLLLGGGGAGLYFGVLADGGSTKSSGESKDDDDAKKKKKSKDDDDKGSKDDDDKGSKKAKDDDDDKGGKKPKDDDDKPKPKDDDKPKDPPKDDPKVAASSPPKVDPGPKPPSTTKTLEPVPSTAPPVASTTVKPPPKPSSTGPDLGF